MSKHSKKKYTKPEHGTQGYRLMQARKSAGFTQAKLADRLGISRTMLIMYEHNKAQMRYDIIVKCLETLGVSFDEVFGGNDSQKKGIRRFIRVNNLMRKSSNELLFRFIGVFGECVQKDVGGLRRRHLPHKTVNPYILKSYRKPVHKETAHLRIRTDMSL